MLDSLITAAEYADHRRVTQAALSMERARGLGPAYVKIGARVFYRLNDIRAFEKRCRVVPANSRGEARS